MSDTDQGYRVLARKYRPETFDDLMGQEAMVRTLKNAFEAGRIAQAFIMTGIRGTGKTTTARIIAKGMNCIGPDGQGGPTTKPCGQCEHCRAISEGRHVDVLEMDAASNTGVDDIRSMVLDTVAYAPSQARYKIFIIDEVHMLSKSAFNALLKTLEEPPRHVKFIFATTEINKVPVTVLSRCQRFDLRRIEPEVMMAMLSKIAASEGAEIGGDALALITRAAEGSARDATSLLDQAISHGAGETTAEQVRAMLGLADRGRVMDLFDMIMGGRAAEALAELAQQYAEGADPMAVMRDLAEITHWLSVVKITPEAADDPTLPPDERSRGAEMAGRLPMRALTRMWQMLLKALEEVGAAPNAMMAAEMAVIRLTHVADLPPPDELIRKLQSTPAPAGPAPNGAGHGGGQASAPVARAAAPVRMAGGTAAQPVAQAAPALSAFPSFEAVLELIRDRRDMHLLVEAETGIRLVSYSPGRIEFTPAPGAARDLAAKLGTRLQQWTGARWAVTVSNAGGQPTVAETRDAEKSEALDRARSHPGIAAVLAVLPQARLVEVRPVPAPEEEAAAEALPEIEEIDEDWDPFESE
ncbi:DNA polymerase III subunit gamma/tau [Mangrovicoccus sp. HB161399]|uniref:DNA polymerase III subunit gamma/tau n=1 Tax=Mangrovicoccus sp. HB161399 TaxID=2720392 RepID=UPI001553EE4E|nr:DNA polymerase III subunit gamma/tau [Mangrovicoccus sp. HB161399]